MNRLLPHSLPPLLLALCLASAAPALACNEHYFEDVNGNCCPEGPQYGCLVPGQGNISLTGIIKDLITGEQYVCEAAPYAWCTPAQMDSGAAEAKPPPPDRKGIATSVNEDSAHERGNDITAIGAAEQSGQDHAKQSSLEVVKLGADQAASAGAVFCAEAAVEIDARPELAASDSAGCQKSFATANEMQAMAEKLGKKGGLEADPLVVDKEEANDIFRRFEEKFGIGKADYLSRLLGGKGDPKVLEELTGGKVSAEKLGALAAAAPAEDSQNTWITGPATKPKGNLRDSLKKQLAQAAKAKPPSARATPETMSLARNVASEALTPLENQFALPATQELTLFEVVHRKYTEKAPMLLPYLFKR